MKSVYLSSLFAFHFRNFNSIKLIPGSKINIFFGKNGHGKTNLLEAIALACSFKTIRTVKNSELILFKEEQARVKASFGGHHTFSIEADIFLRGKKVKINDKPVKNSAALAQKLAVVSFVPDDLWIVTGSAAHRRHYLDQATNGLFPTYSALYRRFEQALLQRNRLLKSPRLDLQELNSFNQVYVQSAAPLIKTRYAALQILRPSVQENICRIASDTISVAIDYQSEGISSASDEDVIAAELRQQMQLIQAEEYARKTSLCGPHLDDMTILLNGHPARHSASRGQARAIVLALKIAQMHCVSSTRERTPILLLDDVLGELDASNANRLLETVKQMDAQTFITTTQLDLLPKSLERYEAFEIQEGSLIN